MARRPTKPRRRAAPPRTRSPSAASSPGKRARKGPLTPIARRKPGAAARGKTPIDLYYWPTPNGFKISIMLEECRLPYTMIPLNITRGDQFKPEFLAISPNNRMPAIVDHDGPGGRPISVFESGAILQYLGRKTGKFYPRDERGRVEVEQWLYWQMANLGPKAGEANHFRHYAAAEKQLYAIDRFTNEINRIFGVMERASRRTANSSPENIPSPTWPASAGCVSISVSARRSTISPHSSAGSRP